MYKSKQASPCVKCLNHGKLVTNHCPYFDCQCNGCKQSDILNSLKLEHYQLMQAMEEVSVEKGGLIEKQVLHDFHKGEVESISVDLEERKAKDDENGNYVTKGSGEVKKEFVKKENLDYVEKNHELIGKYVKTEEGGKLLTQESGDNLYVKAEETGEYVERETLMETDLLKEEQIDLSSARIDLENDCLSCGLEARTSLILEKEGEKTSQEKGVLGKKCPTKMEKS